MALGAALSLCGCLLLSPLDRHSTSSEAGVPPSGEGASSRIAVPLTTPECPLVYGDTTSADALVVGGYASLGTTNLGDSGPLLDYQLAIAELNQARGLPDPATGSRRHPLAMVVCNNIPADPTAGSSFLDRSLHHLIADLHVPAVVAYLLPDDLKYAFETQGLPNHVFFLSPIGATQSLDMEPDEDLLWHMLGQPADLAPGYDGLSRLVQRYVKQVQQIDAVRVATVTTTAAFDRELAGAVLSLIDDNATFNGKTLAENAVDCPVDGCRYRAFTVDANHSPQSVGAQIVEFKPNIIVSLADDRFTQPNTGVLPTVEAMWRPDAKRPYYVLSPINAGALGDVGDAFRGLLSVSSADTYQRFMGIGVAGAQDPTLYNEYLSRLLLAFQSAPVDTENFYDSVYFLAYAMSAAMDRAAVGQPLTGPGIAAGMRELITGALAYSVGPQGINDVLRALPKGAIRLEGTLGPPDFYPDGTRIDTASVFCFNSSGLPQVQVLRYDASANPPFVGDFNPCFAGFFP
jgi:hypothetical protein